MNFVRAFNKNNELFGSLAMRHTVNIGQLIIMSL